MGKQRIIIALPKSRSGSTFLREVLSAHPRVWIGNELRLYTNLAWCSYFQQAWQAVKENRYPIRGPEAYERIKQAYEKVEKRHPNLTRRARKKDVSKECIIELEKALFPKLCNVVGDKGYVPIAPVPYAMEYSLMDALSLDLPMKVIWIYRDPRDTFTSIARFRAKNKIGGKERHLIWHPLWSHDPYRHSLEWIAAWKNWDRIKKQIPYIEVKYEAFMERPGETLERVVQFLGLGSFEPMWKYFQKNVKRGSLGYWKKYQPNIEERIHKSIFPLMKRLGY